MWFLALAWVLCAEFVAGFAEVIGYPRPIGYTRRGTPIYPIAGAASPTLLDLDGFAHQTAAGAQAGSGFIGTYDAINRGAGITFDTSNKRLAVHIAAMKIVEDGVAQTNVSRNIAAGHRLLVASFYFRITAAPSVLSLIFTLPGVTNPPNMVMNADGTISVRFNTLGTQTTVGTYADSNWHRVDFRADTSGATYTIDWQIDGSAQTQASTGSQTAADMTSWRLGSNSLTHTLTVWFQDFVISGTTGDYPIGPHVVLPLYPTSEGTDSLGSSNPIVDEAGAQANLYQHADDWNGGLPNTTDYLTFTSTTLGDAATNYAEFVYSTPASYTAIWDVIGYVAGFAAGTSADQASTSVKLSDGTNVDFIDHNIDYSGSTTVLGYYRNVFARPSGGWTLAKATGLKTRWGLSGDTSPLPRLSAVMLEYAAPETFDLTVGGGLTPSGAAAKQDQKAAAGAVTPTGAVAKQDQKALAGAQTPSGALSLVRTMARSFGGSLTPTGALAKAVSDALAGSLAPAGGLTREVRKLLAGLLDSAGDLVLDFEAGGQEFTIDLAGALTPVGDLLKLAAKALAGAEAPAGAVGKAVGKGLAGNLEPAGDLSFRRILALALSGTLDPSGGLARTISKATGGAVAPSGDAQKDTAAAMTGALVPAGAITKRASVALGGDLAPSGALTTVVHVFRDLLLGAARAAGRYTMAASRRWSVGAGIRRWLSGGGKST